MSSAQRSPLLAYAAATATTVIGQLGLIFAPFLLPFAKAQANLGDTEAARVLSGEFLGYFLVALAASLSPRFAPRAVVFVGGLAFAAASLASALSTDPAMFLIARVCVGMASGALMVGAGRMIASRHDFARMFAVALVGTTLFAIFGLVFIPALFQSQGPAAAYAALGSLGLLAALLSPGMTKGTRTPPPGARRFEGAALVMLAAYFLSRLSDAAVWPYIERFGQRVGFDTAAVGIILAGATVLAVAGPLLSLKVLSLRGHVVMFAAVLGVKAASPLLMAMIATPAMYIAAQAMISITVVLASQLFLTHFTAVDAAGRLTGFAGTVALAADAAGVSLASRAFSEGSYDGVALVSATIGGLALLICLPALGLGRTTRVFGTAAVIRP